MRNPLWILNASLTLIFLLVVTIVLITKKRMPARKSLKTIPVEITPKKTLSLVDIRRIYENDLFKTYQAPLIPLKPVTEEVEVPNPPMPKIPPRIQPPHVQFLEPLKISVRGIINTSDQINNKAIIVDEKTKKEDIYSIGSTIEDAEIIRITSNKVIFIRSNGQEEVVFITANQADNDPIFEHTVSWDNIIHKVKDFSYEIDPELFIEKIHNVAQFVEMLDLTTAFIKDNAAGCQIGILSTESIGHSLGLQENDIITTINDMPISTTKERVKAYHEIKHLPLDASIHVKIQRNRQEHELLYTMRSSNEFDTQKTNSNQKYQKSSVIRQKDQDINDKLESNNVANSYAKNNNFVMQEPPAHVNQIIMQDKAVMDKYGGRAALLQRTT